MIGTRDDIKIYAFLGKTNMCWGAHRLAGEAQAEISGGPFTGDWYMFCGPGRKKIKIVYWERNGFCLWQKRLERDKFPWPKKGSGVRELTREECKMILKGIDIWKEHQSIDCKKIF